MISFEQMTIATMLLYGGAALGGITGMLLRNGGLKKTACGLAVAGFLSQTFFLLMGSHAALPGGLSWGAYLQLLAWFLIVCGIAGWWKLRLEAPLLFAAPLALILFLMSHRYLNMQVRLPETLTTPFYALHIGALFLSLGLLALGFGAGVLFLYLERKIKAKTPLSGFRKDLPALTILDKINAAATLAGFPLYTVGMVAGLVWAGSAWGTAMTGDPKEIISILIWVLYALLFHLRLAQGWRGRKPALLAIWLFALCVFSFLVVNSFMDTHHSFIKRQ